MRQKEVPQNTDRIDRTPENGPICRYFMRAILYTAIDRKSDNIARNVSIARVIDRARICRFAGLSSHRNPLRAIRAIFCGPSWASSLLLILTSYWRALRRSALVPVPPTLLLLTLHTTLEMRVLSRQALGSSVNRSNPLPTCRLKPFGKEELSSLRIGAARP